MSTAVAEVTIEQRVAEGADLLDTEHPDWWRTIDIGRLDLADRCRCVLGQIWGDYYQAPITLDDAVLCGFDASEATMAAPEEFTELTEAWLALIERRRAEAGAAQ